MDEIDFSSFENVDLESLEQELAKIDPAELRYLSQLLSENVPAVKKIIRNVLVEPLSETRQVGLTPPLPPLQPLQPKPYKPIAPARNRKRRQKAKRKYDLLREFDPIHPQNIRNVGDNQNEVEAKFKDETTEGEEKRNGRRFIRWRIKKDLERDQTPKFMEKIRKEVRTSFFLRYVFAFNLRNIEDDTFLTYYQSEKGSRWIQKLEDAEKWLKERESERLEVDAIERPDTKWIFDHYFAVDVKVVLDREP